MTDLLAGSANHTITASSASTTGAHARRATAPATTSSPLRAITAIPSASCTRTTRHAHDGAPMELRPPAAIPPLTRATRTAMTHASAGTAGSRPPAAITSSTSARA
jgi:hypothetical protein